MAKAEHHFGIHAITALLESQPEQVLGLFLLSGRQDAALNRLQQLASQHGIAVQWVGRDTLDRLTDRGRHQGVVASVRPIPVQDERDLMQLLDQRPQALLLALDEVSDPHNLGACLRSAAAMGADAVVVPRDRSSGLTPTVRKVAAGGVFVTPATAEALAQAVGQRGAQAGPEALSHREHQVFRLLIQGLSVTQIGAQLGLAGNTVSTYRARILEKTGTRNDVELALYAERQGSR